jgi:hypothetical protein
VGFAELDDAPIEAVNVPSFQDERPAAELPVVLSRRPRCFRLQR